MADEPDENDTPAELPEAAGKPASQRKLILVSAAVVVVLAAVGVVVYLLVGNDDQDTASGTDVPTITGSATPTTETTSSQPAQPPTTGAPDEPPAEGDPAEAKSVAEDAVTAISSGDVAAITQLSCDPTAVDDGDTYPSDAKAEVAGEPKITGDTATVDVRLTIGDTEPTIVPMPLTKQNGRWCIP